MEREKENLNYNFKYRISISYIHTVIFRVLPNIKYDFEFLHQYYKDSKINRYFKNVRKLQEYPGVYDFLASRGLKMDLCNIVRTQIDSSRNNFFSNIKLNHKLTMFQEYNKGICGINQAKLDYVCYRFEKYVMCDADIIKSELKIPTEKRVLDQVNKSASQGLPDPFVKKRDIIQSLADSVSLFYCTRLKSEDIFKYPSAAFARFQVRSTGLKSRVVNAVNALHATIESFYYIYFMDVMPRESCIDIGRTQAEISHISSSYKDYYTYSVDYSG